MNEFIAKLVEVVESAKHIGNDAGDYHWKFSVESVDSYQLSDLLEWLGVGADDEPSFTLYSTAGGLVLSVHNPEIA